MPLQKWCRISAIDRLKTRATSKYCMAATHGYTVADPSVTEADAAVEATKAYAARQTKCNIDSETHRE